MHPRTEYTAGPSGSGTVVLELGPGAGALVLHVPAELNGAEICISESRGDGHRAHSAVRPRHIAIGIQYAAVYPDLPPGRYTVFRQDGTTAANVTVIAGEVTSTRWPVRDCRYGTSALDVPATAAPASDSSSC